MVRVGFLEFLAVFSNLFDFPFSHGILDERLEGGGHVWNGQLKVKKLCWEAESCPDAAPENLK